MGLPAGTTAKSTTVGAPVSSAKAACTTQLTVGTAYADVVGASVSVTAYNDNAVVIVTGVFDVNVTSASAGVIAIGQCMVDGALPAPAIATHDLGTVGRHTVTQTWRAAVGAGAHTIKLQASKTAAGGTATVLTVHTTITAILIDTP